MFRIVLFAIALPFCLLANLPLTSKIPLIIWQTYKSKTLPLPAIEVQQSWIQLNPEFTCYLFDDADIERYIQQKWSSDFLDLFHALPLGAMKADLWRYLILATEGGVYTDIDSICLQPIREWPVKGSSSNFHFLLLDLDNNQEQFCQWTLACTPQHPAMQYICHYVLKKWKKEGFPKNKDRTLNVLAATGPAIFTSALISYLGEPNDMNAYKIEKKYRKNADYRKRLNNLGIYMTRKGYFSGEGVKNLSWGSGCLGDEYSGWSNEAKKLADEKHGDD